jgi:putative transmembrane protein PGPGW
MISIKAIKRIAILVVGSTVLTIGVALLVLPGPAFIVIPVGLTILAVEFAWARRWLLKARELLPNTNGTGGFYSSVVRHLKNFLEWRESRNKLTRSRLTGAITQSK